jgi:hypothetical protein
MAHYAFLDENNIVTEVIVGIDETETIEGLDIETWYGNFRNQKCVRTSYNGKIRKSFAGIGYSYDPIKDVFISPQPFTSWTLNDNSDWIAPVDYPTDGVVYEWNENLLNWSPVVFPDGYEAKTF